MKESTVRYKKRFLSAIIALAACSDLFAGDVSRQMMELRFSFTDYLSYYTHLLLTGYLGTPWVVRVSYVGLILCGVTIIVFMHLLFHIWRTRRRNDRFYYKFGDYYYNAICDILADEESLEMNEVIERTRYNDASSRMRKENWKKWQFWQVGKLLMTAKSANYDNYNTYNLSSLVKLFGLDSFIDRELAYTINTDHVKALQMAQFLIIKVPESSLVRLLNSKDVNTRKETRMYYMMIDDFNPFRFFEEGNVDYEYRKWDDLEIHHLLLSRKHMGKPIPSLLSLILQTEDVELKSCLIREVAFWGSQKDVQRMEKYITGKELAFRQAAVECIGISKNKHCEKDLVTSYTIQPENLRKEIIKTIYLIRSGEQAEFFVSAYKQTVVQSTRYVALYFMYLYNVESRMLFNQLEQEVKESEKQLFAQVRAYIELAKRRNAA